MNVSEKSYTTILFWWYYFSFCKFDPETDSEVSNFKDLFIELPTPELIRMLTTFVRKLSYYRFTKLFILFNLLKWAKIFLLVGPLWLDYCAPESFFGESIVLCDFVSRLITEACPIELKEFILLISEVVLIKVLLYINCFLFHKICIIIFFQELLLGFFINRFLFFKVCHILIFIFVLGGVFTIMFYLGLESMQIYETFWRFISLEYVQEIVYLFSSYEYFKIWG